MKSQLLRETKPSNCGSYARVGVGLGLILGSLAGLGALMVSGSAFGAPALFGMTLLGCLAMGLGAILICCNSLKPVRNQDRYNRLRDSANGSINGDEGGHYYQNPSAPPMATPYYYLEAGGGGAKGMGLSPG